MKVFVIALCMVRVISFAQSPVACPHTDPLNARIVGIASSKLGTTVDRGECWDLAKLVLNETDADWDGLYRFGRLLNLETDCIQPGDIIQFEKVLTHVNVGRGYHEESFSHHTAIVHRVLGPGKVELIHQNFGRTGRKVGLSTFDFSTVKRGSIFVYRPVKKVT